MTAIQPICRTFSRLTLWKNVASTLAVPSTSTRCFSKGSLVPFGGGFYRPSNVIGEFQNRVEQMERDFDRYFGLGGFGFRPFVDFEHPTSTELFRLKNPIVEEDGVKKFKLEFDVRRFRPEDVKISTDSKAGTLTVEAKHSDEHSKFEYVRKISIPEGVKPEELTCTYKGNGVLSLEAPYVATPEKEPPKDTPIQIKHE
uniref:Small heat shock protein n=1 Tax=Tomicus yunnanensis TaxID=768153 RepID=A0A482E8G2_9CUCU|nr:small heat shock protein [Tomicus yunnanensis]